MTEYVINDMINQARGVERQILLKLKHQSKLAFDFIENNRTPCKSKNYTYNAKLCKNTIHQDAKKLLATYYELKGMTHCEACGEVIRGKKLYHHLSYKNYEELYTPDLLWQIHPRCHQKGTKWSRNKK